jgi:rhodanese-related sulfurtransferase
MTGNSFGQSFSQISVEELGKRLSSGDPELQLVDVREIQEIEISSITGFVNLPLSEFSQWGEQITDRLNPHAETLVLCHHGIRSAQMCQWLIAQGFTNVKNIVGGIAAYSTIVDSTIPQY